MVKMPWAERASRFTALFQVLAIEWQGGQSESGSRAVEGELGRIHGILEQCGLARHKAEPVSQIGVDEKEFRKGHNYLTGE